MALRSRYREKSTPVPDIPVPEIPIASAEQPEAVIGISAQIPDETIAQVEPTAPIEPATDANAAEQHLAQQLGALKAAGELQRRQAQVAAMAAQALPPTREQRLEAWKAQGMTEQEAEFLRDNPGMIDYPQVTQQAVAAALHSGLERGSDNFHKAVENNFNTMMARVEAQAQPATADPAGFFQPSAAPRSPAPARSPEPSMSAYVSAPVSRHGHGSASPSHSIRLSPAEQEYARIAGITDTEYARQKRVLLQRKANGDYGEQR
jgi:hypothetical protein